MNNPKLPALTDIEQPAEGDARPSLPVVPRPRTAALEDELAHVADLRHNVQLGRRCPGGRLRSFRRPSCNRKYLLTHFCPPLCFSNQIPTFAVRETDVSRHNGGTSGAPLKPLGDDSVLRALSSLRGLIDAWLK